MVKLNKIYTRSGDDGSTALADGSRRAKCDPRINCYGDIDEAGAAIGLARLHTKDELDKILARLQNDLFDLGADLATPPASNEKDILRITAAQTSRLEKEIDELNAALTPLASFVLAGGSPAAAHLHLARTILRRAERGLVAAQTEGETFTPESCQFLNRASDLIFVAARFANWQAGVGDVLWQPAQNR